MNVELAEDFPQEKPFELQYAKLQNAPMLLVPSPHQFGKTVLQMIIFQVLDNVCEQICFPQKDCVVGGLGET